MNGDLAIRLELAHLQIVHLVRVADETYELRVLRRGSRTHLTHFI